jgi:hypothetical protein
MVKHVQFELSMNRTRVFERDSIVMRVNMKPSTSNLLSSLKKEKKERMYFVRATRAKTYYSMHEPLRTLGQ